MIESANNLELCATASNQIVSGPKISSTRSSRVLKATTDAKRLGLSLKRIGILYSKNWSQAISFWFALFFTTPNTNRDVSSLTPPVDSLPKRNSMTLRSSSLLARLQELKELLRNLLSQSRPTLPPWRRTEKLSLLGFKRITAPNTSAPQVQ